MSKEFFNTHAHVWDGFHSEQDPAKLEQLTARFDIKPGSKMLDVGSGTGILLHYLLRYIGPEGEVVALDYAEEMLKVSRSKKPEPNIRYVTADVSSIPLKNEMFDTVVCYSCFPHFDDKPKALSEINRVLKGKGRLFICHTSSRHEINEMHRSITAVGHASLPDGKMISKLLTQAGFGNITIEDNTASYFASATKL